MNPQKERSPLPPPDLPTCLVPSVPAAAKGSAAANSDCLYQFAALIVGAFMLATLL